MEDMQLFAPANEKEKQAIINNLTKGTAAFGIDLGTTNSAISVIPRGTAPIIIPLRNGKTTIPSCVMWTGKDREFIVGREAYEQRYKENCCYSVKRLMQDPDATVTLKVDDKELVMTPAEISAEILKGLVAETNGYYGDIKDVVITVPAKFNEIGRKNTKLAAELAGLNLLGIISEPTSASMCYELTPKDNGSRDLLVYDLGGGTFDISLVRITGAQDYSHFEELYSIPISERRTNVDTTIRALDGDGNVTLGGDDIDREIYNNFITELKERGVDTSLISTQEEHRVILLIEKMKKGNPHDITQIHINLTDGTEAVVNLSYNEFRQGLIPIYEKTKKLVNMVLKRNRTTADAIVLVGGSTKNSILKELLAEDYPGYEINDAFPADEAVSLGAAVHARFLKFGDNNISVFDNLVDSIGVCNGEFVSTIIPSGSQFPVTKYKLYDTVEDNQEAIEVIIVQGNTTIAAEANQLGVLTIDNLPKGKQGRVEIKIQLSIDVRGLLRCAVDIRNLDDKLGSVLHRDLELKLTSGNKSAEKLTKEEKIKIRWRNFANTLEEPVKSEFLALVDAYPTTVTLDKIQTELRRLQSERK